MLSKLSVHNYAIIDRLEFLDYIAAALELEDALRGAINRHLADGRVPLGHATPVLDQRPYGGGWCGDLHTLDRLLACRTVGKGQAWQQEGRKGDQAWDRHRWVS